MDLYLRVRLACHVDGLSQREAASRFGIARETVRKMLRHSEPPGYRRRQPPKRPKLAPFTDIIDRILEEDRTVHRKQHHTAKRIFERLRDEHGFTGKETVDLLNEPYNMLYYNIFYEYRYFLPNNLTTFQYAIEKGDT